MTSVHDEHGAMQKVDGERWSSVIVRKCWVVGYDWPELAVRFRYPWTPTREK